MTTPELTAAAAGTSIRKVARHWPVYKRGLREKQLHNRITRIRRAWKHGNLNLQSADKLGKLMNCDPGIFLYGATTTEGLSGYSPQRRGR